MLTQLPGSLIPRAERRLRLCDLVLDILIDVLEVVYICINHVLRGRVISSRTGGDRLDLGGSRTHGCGRVLEWEVDADAR